MTDNEIKKALECCVSYSRSECAECKYCYDEVCVNADCPLVADFCPVSDTPDVCKWEKRETDKQEIKHGECGAKMDGGKND